MSGVGATEYTILKSCNTTPEHSSLLVSSLPCKNVMNKDQEYKLIWSIHGLTCFKISGYIRGPLATIVKICKKDRKKKNKKKNHVLKHTQGSEIGIRARGPDIGRLTPTRLSSGLYIYFAGHHD